MPKKIDVILVTPPSRLEVYQELSGSLAAIEPPVWSGLIAQFLLNNGFEVVIIDAEAEGLDYASTASEIAKYEAYLVVFVVYGQQPSASTQCMPGASKTCRAFKEISDTPTMVMGTHASALPLRTLQEEPFDYVCQGEGPHTTLYLLKALKNSKLTDLSSIPGLWYMQKGLPQHSRVAEKIDNLDLELPHQALQLLDMKKYRAHNWHCFDNLESRHRYASLQTSLGCPYKCSFCCINAPFGGPGIRYWSPSNIIKQIDTMVNIYNVRNIKIPDEMFVLNRNHVIEICDAIIERGYKLNIWAYARIDTVKDDYLEKLKKAGFNWLGIGIESGSKFVRDGVEKGRFGEEEIVKTVNKIREHGIYVAANYIFGLPDDTINSMQETLDLAMFLNTEWANFYSAMAYPGSALFNKALENNWMTPDQKGGPGWIGYSQHAYESMPLPTNTLSYQEVINFRDAAFDHYFSDPAYLKMIEKTFGAAVVDHINHMTTYKIKRLHRAT